MPTGEGWDDIVRRHRRPEPLYVMRPALPPFERYVELLKGVWERKWLTNHGELHNALSARMAEYLGVGQVSLFCNGTAALLTAFKALGIGEGEVITTPFTFPATPHALSWNGLRPVFADIDPARLTLDPARVEAAITPRTRAILGVHVYGIPCHVEALDDIARRHGLPIVYDAAHAFGAVYQGRSLTAYGDISMLSFHATKLFSTVEGGALTSRDPALHEKFYLLKNFGIRNEETVDGVGMNGKLNELQAAYGLLQLEMVEEQIGGREKVGARYRERLAAVGGVSLPGRPPGWKPNGAYFPILIDEAAFGASRDDLHRCMRACNIVTRKYFFPLCSRYPCYSDLPSARPENLPVAARIAQAVLCLPMHAGLAHEEIDAVCDVVVEVGRRG